MLPLYVPISYREASKITIARVCNGCGAKGGTKFPDTMWGLLIILACQIHDWMFHVGKTKGDMWFANAMFFWNLTAIIINNSNWFMLFLRMERALKYFLGTLTSKGRYAYWDNKEKNDILTVTYNGELILNFKDS